MDNSLQDSAGSFTFSGMKKLAQTIIATLLSFNLSTLAAAADEVCVGDVCTVTFSYTGAAQQWSVPAGATSISFEVYGASGARGGGGGLITGSLVGSFQTLTIVVGGAGSQGNNAAGGFNGGGRAGGNRGNEGSGGGASDIRIGSELSDRIVVAGGGGGGGGYSGASGAAGGGLLAPAGPSGQGGGGGGGTQVAGGTAGYSNGGSAASAGSFGQGGTGGTSWNAGGGGGGGGWYGGGGGGGDDDDCCDDGGGGGGGSSYASESHTINVSHQVGVKSGHGRVVLSYQLLPSVVSFEGEQLSSQSAVATLTMSKEIVGLEAQDFEVSGGCAIGELSVASYSATIGLISCSSAVVTLTLLANSVGSGSLGPAHNETLSFPFDGDPPEFEWLSHPSAISSSELVVSYTVSDNVRPITTESFQVEGCSFELSGEQLSLFDCVEGEVALALVAGQLSDSWGNAGPTDSVSTSFLVDQSGPSISVGELLVTGSETFSYSFVVTLLEPASYSPQSVSFTASMECESGFNSTDSSITLWAQCGYGSGSWLIPAGWAVDELGNRGPIEPITLSFDYPEPAAAPEVPEPVVVAPPAPAPPPASAPDPVVVIPPPAELEPQEPVVSQSPVITESPEVSSSESEEVDPTSSPELEAELEEILVEALEPQREPIGTSAPAPSQTALPEAVSQSDEVTLSPVITNEEISEPIEAEPVLGQELEIADSPQPPWFAFGLVLLLGVVGLGVWRAIGR